MNKIKYTIEPLRVGKDEEKKWMAQYEKRETVSGGFNIEIEPLDKVFKNIEDAKTYTYDYLIKKEIDKEDIYEK